MQDQRGLPEFGCVLDGLLPAAQRVQDQLRLSGKSVLPQRSLHTVADPKEPAPSLAKSDRTRRDRSSEAKGAFPMIRGAPFVFVAELEPGGT